MEDLTSPRVLRETLRRYGLSPRKSLGQNFLIDANLRDKIVKSAALGPGDLAVEIGSGPGTMTGQLLAEGASVLAIEADRGLARVLTDRLPPRPGVLEVLVGDVLGIDLDRAVEEAGFSGMPAAAVGNLPYYITSQIIFHLFNTALPWRCMVLLVQREVAERMAARPGSREYGLLTVMIGYRARVEIITTMPPSVFWPPPKVHSSLIRLNLDQDWGLGRDEERLFFGLCRAAFGQRRKTLAQACRRWAEDLNLKVEFAGICSACGIDPGRRGESLATAEFVGLAAALSRRMGGRSVSAPSRKG